MRALIIAILFFAAAIHASAQAPQYLESQVNEVKIFKSGAQIKKTAAYDVKAGTHLLVLRGISYRADLQTLQVSLSPGISIISISAHLTKNPDPRKVPIIKMLEDTLKAITLRHSLEQNTLRLYDEQLSILAANKKLGTDKGVSAAEIEDALDVYQSRLPGILKAKLESEMRLQSLLAAKKEAETRLENFRKTNDMETYELRVLANTTTAAKGDVTVEYYTPEAGWEPQYDLMSDGSGPLQVIFKVKIWQSTFDNWNNVNIRLFSGKPALAGNTPDLKPEYLKIYQPAAGGVTSNRMYLEGAMGKADDAYDSIPMLQGTDDYGTAGIEYKLPAGINLSGDGSIISAEIKRETIQARYRHFSVPKLDRDVFLVAQVGDWHTLEMLAGEANIYFRGSFVGRTFIDPRNPQDTMHISLGRDKKVLAFRTAVKEQSKKQVSGSKIVAQNTWQLLVKNDRNMPVEVLLEDQIPLSVSPEIEVKVRETGGAQYDPATGKLSWLLVLQPAESKTVRFGYELKYPKDRIIGN